MQTGGLSNPQVLLNQPQEGHSHDSKADLKSGANYEFGEFCSPGMRKNMEDYVDHYIEGEYQAFAVYDGHGGKQVAEHCSKMFLKHLVQNLKTADGDIEDAVKHAYSSFNKGILSVPDWDDVGACAVTIVVKTLANGERLLIIANCGDCYAVLGRKSQTGCVAVELSIEHHPSDPSEIERISKLGGTCAGGRLWGGYAHVGVSRSMGDNAFVNGDNGRGMTCEPSVCIQLLSSDDLFLILGSDGLLVRGSLEQEEITQFVYKQLKIGCSPQQAAVEVVRFALNRGSCDNISAVVILFTSSL